MQNGEFLLTDLHFALCTLHSTFLVSVIGLAPIRPGLKDRLLDLLCIHGRKDADVPGERERRVVAHWQTLTLAQQAAEWSRRLVSRQRLLLFREALIYLSYSGMLADGGNCLIHKSNDCDLQPSKMPACQPSCPP